MAAGKDQPWSSYDQASVLNKRVVPDVISLIDPVDTPFIAKMGLDGARSKFNLKLNGRQVEWLMDQYRQTTAELAATCASDGTQLTVTDATPLKIGDVVLMPDEAEYVNVTGISYTGDTIDVVRAFGTTTAATQATGALEILWIARIEGADADYGPIETVSSALNYTMVLEDAKKITGTELAVDQYGISNPMEYQRRKIIPEQMKFLERAALRSGYRAVGTKTAARLMGGLPYFITTNTATMARTALALTDFRAAVLSSYNAGGNMDMCVVNPQTLNTLADIYDNTGYLRVEVEENRLGMAPKRIHTPFASFDAIASKWCAAADIWLLDSRHIGFYTLRPLAEKVLAISGDYDALEIVGEFTMCVKHEDAHARLVLS